MSGAPGPAPPLTIGTAGHIDHGKTRLVKALTGVDTDRLPAERARGISIELGYARLVLDDGRQLSLIDVPGHERFVRTMVAGATGIDLFLLVVDAAEGPRPQTLEHLQILRLLEIEHGVAAVTKIDTSPPEQVDATTAAVRELLPGTEVVPVSAASGAGLDELRAAVARAAGHVARRAGVDAARLYVDRVFAPAGVGTVVTGTLWSGEVAVGDHLQVLPAAFSARVRGVQVHGTAVDRAAAGQRVALNLVPDRRGRLARGAAVVAPGAYPASYRLDVVLEPGSELPTGLRVDVCHGTSAVQGRVVRIGGRYAQLRVDRPLVTARGDRLVLRRGTTVGGGRILDPSPPRHADESRLARLDVADPQELLGALVHEPVRLEALRARGLLGAEDLERALGSLERAGEWVFAASWVAATRAAAAAALAAREGELDPGLPVGELLGPVPWSREIAPLLALERRDGKLYLPGRRPGVDRRRAAAAVLERQLASAGLEPVRPDDAELARQLEREGRLVRLGDGLAIGADAYERARQLLVGECEAAGTITLARFRDLLGTSRRVAQLLLERLDTDRVTLRVGETRRLRRSARPPGRV